MVACPDNTWPFCCAVDIDPTGYGFDLCVGSVGLLDQPLVRVEYTQPKVAEAIGGVSEPLALRKLDV
jgi:hypothetical protein